MIEPKAAVVALTFVVLASHGASAQIASKVQAGTIMTQQDGEVPASIFSVAPGIRVDLPYLALAGHGSAWLTGQQWQIADGTLSGSLLTPTVSHWRGELIGNASLKGEKMASRWSTEPPIRGPSTESLNQAWTREYGARWIERFSQSYSGKNRNKIWIFRSLI